MPARKEPAGAAAETTIWPRNVLTVLFFAAGVLVLSRLIHPVNGSAWPEAALALLAVAATIAALMRALPLQNVMAAALLIASAGGAVEFLDLKTGIPFGPFTPERNTGPKMLSGLPWVLPLVWIVAVLNSRGVARLILRPWRKFHGYGFRLIYITAVLAMLFDFAFEPFASRVKQYWSWGTTKLPLSWEGVPLVNYFGWLAVTLLILAFITPMLINKQPHKRLSSDFHPLAFWLGGVLLFGAAAALNRLWLATVADAAIGIVTAVFAIRGAKW